MSVVRRIVAAGMLAALVVCATPAWATPVVWNSGPGNNGHSYEVIVVSSAITWDDAQADAVARGGYLATILTADENNFVFGLVDSAAYWVTETPTSSANLGPWLGGFQTAGSAEPGGGWTWLNGVGTFAFTNWMGGEPNNGPGPHGLTESRLHYFAYGGRGATWNDYPATFTGGTPGFSFAGPIAYVVESESATTAVPEPATVLLIGGGLAAFLARQRGRRQS